MAELSPDTLALWISRDIENASFRTLSVTSIDVLRRRLGPEPSDERIAEMAEGLAPRLLSPLERLREEALEDGVEPSFELFVDEDTAHIKAVRGEAQQILARLRDMDPDDFESFCVRVLQALKSGGEGRVLGRSGDGGVDFAIRGINLCDPASIGARVFVIGQAKRYAATNLVSETELREFVGGAIRRLHNHEDVATFRPGVLAPISYAFWTTSEFQPTARRWARAMGLWYLNGVGVAQLAIRLGIEL